jgi:hypothetical protein
MLTIVGCRAGYLISERKKVCGAGYRGSVVNLNSKVVVSLFLLRQPKNILLHILGKGKEMALDCFTGAPHQQTSQVFQNKNFGINQVLKTKYFTLVPIYR